MASCNPVAPVMDWTEDMEWKEEVELEIGSTLSGKFNSVKSNYVLRWAEKPARAYLKSLPVHDPISHNWAVAMSYTYIILPHNLNSIKLHLQGVAPRSQYSDHTLEALTLQ